MTASKLQARIYWNKFSVIVLLLLLHSKALIHFFFQCGSIFQSASFQLAAFGKLKLISSWMQSRENSLIAGYWKFSRSFIESKYFLIIFKAERGRFESDVSRKKQQNLCQIPNHKLLYNLPRFSSSFYWNFYKVVTHKKQIQQVYWIFMVSGDLRFFMIAPIIPRESTLYSSPNTI